MPRNYSNDALRLIVYVHKQNGKHQVCERNVMKIIYFASQRYLLLADVIAVEKDGTEGRERITVIGTTNSGISARDYLRSHKI